ncbi:MAG: RNA-guided endonuclease InsQ/TnpB family protein [Cyanobacteriota bacterium]
MLTLTYEYKLQVTKQQSLLIEQTLDVCRSVWNFALRERKDWLNSRKSSVNACSIHCEYIISVDEPFPGYHQQAKNLTQAKKSNERLRSVNAQVLQQVLRTLDRAFSDMQAKGFGFPRFKNKYQIRSYVYPQLGKDIIRGNQVKLPQLGWVKFRKSRDIPEGFNIKQARIVRKASGYFVLLSLQLDVDIPQPFPHGHPLGLDLGFDKFVATSDGEEIKRPRFLKTLQRKIKLLQRRLRNKKKGSNNRAQLNQKIARLHQRISDTRKDWHFKLAHHLCDGEPLAVDGFPGISKVANPKGAGMIFVEDINFRSWQRGMLSQHAADAGFGQFVEILQWVCWKRDVYFAKENKDGTSQECSQCGAHTGKKTLNVRVHHCPECGYIGPRDVVSAEVVRNRGLSAVGLIVDIKENACGDGLTGAKETLSSQVSQKQEILTVKLGISRHSA